MSRRVFVTLVFTLLALAVLLPGSAYAQSAIAGVVRDTSGAVLPGVTVEASSPALIEKVRTVNTDAEGLYRVIDLRPGTYTVTFTLPGFSPVRREGIVLETNFTANVNADLRVGTLEETVTVSGQTPVVDISSAARAAVLTRDLLEALPARAWATNTVPAITRPVDVGGSSTMVQGTSKAYGAQVQEIKLDGMSVTAAAGYPGVYYNFDSFEEVVYEVGGGTAESVLAGVTTNMIPRQGGNQLSGDTTIIFSNERFTSSNYSDELRQRGLQTPSGLYELYDVNASLGGPIKRDKLWFFGSTRAWKTDSYVANAFNPDGSRAVDDYKLNNYTIRLTYQLSPRNKISALYDASRKAQGHRGFSPGFSPEAAYQSLAKIPPSGNSVLRYTSTVSNKLLVESAFSTQVFSFRAKYLPEVARPSATKPYGDIAKRDLLRGTTWGAAPSGETTLGSYLYHINSSATYVTGSHSLKVGQQFGSGYAKSSTYYQNGSLVQQYRNGQADSVVVYNTPTNVQTDLDYELAFFAQDSWTMKRWTFNPGIRYDRHSSSVPEQFAAAGRFVPERRFAAMPGLIQWNDISPRVSAVYDLFGNGRTALKGSVGKYPEFVQTQAAAAYNPMTATGGTGSAVTDTRTWTDRNGNDIAEEDELGASTNNRFGLGLDRFVDPNLKRPYSWMTSVGLQHQLWPGVGVSVTYNRQDFRRMIWTDNRQTTFDDYTLVTIPDPRGNGQTLPVYNLNVNKRGLVDNYDTNSDKNRRLYNGVDLSLTSRFRNGTVTVASSTGRLDTVTCEVDDPNALRFCDTTALDTPFLTSFRFVATYQLPRDIRVSGVFQSAPGGAASEPIYPTNYIVNRTIVPNLTNASVTVRLDEPGSQRYPQINQLDFVVGKNFRRGRVQLIPRLEVANTLNVNTVLVQVTSFGSSLGTPQRILPGRTARLNLLVKF